VVSSRQVSSSMGTPLAMRSARVRRSGSPGIRTGSSGCCGGEAVMYWVIAAISVLSHSRSISRDGSITIVSMPLVAVPAPCRSGRIVPLPHKAPASISQTKASA